MTTHASKIPPTKIPVTLSGWYELTDGRYRYFWWDHGQLKAGRIIQSMADVAPRDAFHCPECGAVSYNRNDIQNLYCGRCHRFMDERK